MSGGRILMEIQEPTDSPDETLRVEKEGVQLEEHKEKNPSRQVSIKIQRFCSR